MPYEGERPKITSVRSRDVSGYSQRMRIVMRGVGALLNPPSRSHDMMPMRSSYG